MNTVNNISYEFYRLKIIEFLESRINLIAVYFYGSILSSVFNDESDIDIAIIAENETDNLFLYELSAELSVITKRDIHLVDFIRASDILKIEILKNKNVAFEKDESKRLYHEMNALTAYEKFNEEREIVIKAKYGEGAWISL